MPIYSDDVLEDLRQGNDIVDIISQYVQLRQSGANYMGLCPFHREKSPSFSVSAQKQFFHCFGCGAGGNVFTFIMKIENFGFMDAVKFLADKINYTLPETSSRSSVSTTEKNTMYDIYKSAARFYYDSLQEPRGQAASAYLDGRRITPGIRRKFGLGYAPGGVALRNFLNTQGYEDKFLERAGLILESRGGRGFFDRFRDRLMFPIFDVTGKVIGFGGRILDKGEPKYLNSPKTPIFDKSFVLYGLNYARQAKTDTVVLVEGYTDVIAMYQGGFLNAVAPLGTAFTANHARILKRYFNQVIVLLDGDEAGWRATLRTIWLIYAAGFETNIKVAVLPDAKDPDEYLIRFGAEQLKKQFDDALDFVVHHIQAARKKYNITTPTERIAFLKEVSEVTKRFNTAIEREVYERYISEEYGISQAAIRDYMSTEEIESTFTPILTPPTARTVGPQKSRRDAVAHVLHSMAANSVLFDKIRAHLEACEMAEPLFVKLYQAIVSARERGREVILGDIITMLDSEEEQAAAAGLFASLTEYGTTEALHEALAQQIRLLKETWLDGQISGTDDVFALNELMKAKNLLKNTKIVL